MADSSSSAMATAMNGSGSKEGNGDSNKVGGKVMPTTTKRAMGMAIRVAGNKEGNGDRGKSNGDSVKGSGQRQ